ncbi:HD-GYP domain-containing protein [Paenibacillus lautus]|uniref:HD-GYP domain-containing protein n=1 Tax=Paenibacillus lautus TaxID=1401 RepID=A0A385TJ77_PAELA|nr:HD-GYP domain-containing protein [Paenibacillus lautus]AYB42694.1 HD-GYP domain-containing protein [Paenibacillus lautus]MCI1775126.1 HD-GYP domain-containing protein [Paenibacillus lautus]
MRVHVTDLKPGDQIQQDAYNTNGVHVLQKGALLRSEDISKLLQHGIDYIEIQPRALSVSLDPLSEISDSFNKVKPHFNLAFDGCSALFTEASQSGKFNESVVDDVFQPLVGSLNEHTDVVSLLLLFNGTDDYTYRHSIQVGMLSYYIADWMGYSDKEAYEIGKAGYLHDIGKSKISRDILDKPGKLTPEEFEEVKLHTIYGYEMIAESMDDKVTAMVALQHHERDDRSGYPRALHADQIHPYSHICAVADVYSAMTTNRVYQSKQQLLTVLRELYGLSFGKLNGKPTHAFIQQMLPNFIGKKVLLTTGESGIIVMNHPSDYFRPLVKTDDRFIDLSKEYHTEIQEILL